MERAVKIVMTESDAKLLMQICSMLSYDTIGQLISDRQSSYEKMDMKNRFNDYYSDFTIVRAYSLLSGLTEQLEEIFIPQGDVVVNMLGYKRLEEQF